MAGTRRILDSKQEELVDRVRSSLSQLEIVLARLPAEPEDERTVRAAVQQLDDFFLLVIVGEFNSGKSALINALLGERVVEEGVTPTTSQIQILRHSEQSASASDDGIRVLSATSDLLRDLHLVDTPGANAITREHEALTERFIPRADLILFITSADRPFTESERAFMERIRKWGKKVVLVINKADILPTPEDLEQVRGFVRDNVHALLGFSPDLFAVSARQAFSAKQHGEETPVASGFAELETYIRTKLDDTERFRLKLLNPIGIGLRLSGKYLDLVRARLEVLREDVATVEEIRTRLSGYQKEMTRGFQLRLADLDNVLLELERKGNEFFEETVRLPRLFDLLDKDRVQADFERKVIGDLPQQIERKVHEIIDWLVASDLQQWQEVRDRLTARKSEQSERIAGRLAGGFEYDRARLLDTVGRSAQQTLESHDHRAEAARMAESVQGAVANAALLEVGAVGLGTAVALAATSTAADVTGILAAGVLATVGFFVIPHRRDKAKKELRERVAQLRKRLMEGLTSQFDAEVVRSVRRVEEAIAPYVQFVEGERAALTDREQELSNVEGRLAAMRSEVGISG